MNCLQESTVDSISRIQLINKYTVFRKNFDCEFIFSIFTSLLIGYSSSAILNRTQYYNYQLSSYKTNEIFNASWVKFWNNSYFVVNSFLTT